MPTLFVRTLIVYTLMFAVLRLMGKRQISDMQPFDLAVTLLIANLATVPMSDPTVPLLYGVIPILALFTVHRAVSFLSLKSERVRKLVCGNPVVIISKGEVCEKAMRAANYSLSDLIEQLRLKDVFSVAAVEYAILETNGSLSVLLKSAEQTPTNGRLGLLSGEEKPAAMLVMDGRIHPDELRKAGVDEKRLRAALKAVGIASPEECFFASLDAEGTFTAQRKEKTGSSAPRSVQLDMPRPPRGTEKNEKQGQ
ncbi:MAG: DUF421 domain-containing protein [Clostridia bacterium]|nr:DUF421 domain-containing protein [Clostridia bacterium]